MSDNLMQGLVTFLEKEIELYQNLLVIAKKKMAALMEGKLAEISELTKTEQTLLLQVGKVEEGRYSLHLQLAKNFSMPPGEFNMSSLVEKIGEPWSGKVKKLQEEFVLVLEELKKINLTNSNLIKQSLDYINFSINVITGIDEGPVYSNKGDKVSASKLFDKKI